MCVRVKVLISCYVVSMWILAVEVRKYPWGCSPIAAVWVTCWMNCWNPNSLTKKQTSPFRRIPLQNFVESSSKLLGYLDHRVLRSQKQSIDRLFNRLILAFGFYGIFLWMCLSIVVAHGAIFPVPRHELQISIPWLQTGHGLKSLVSVNIVVPRQNRHVILPAPEQSGQKSSHESWSVLHSSICQFTSKRTRLPWSATASEATSSLATLDGLVVILLALFGSSTAEESLSSSSSSHDGIRSQLISHSSSSGHSSSSSGPW